MCTAPRLSGVCPSYGSLKTEEKTERQCGQDGHRPDLSVNSFIQINGRHCRSSGSGLGKLEGYSPTRRLALATNAASTSVGVMFLTESLILAQDERWRRA